VVEGKASWAQKQYRGKTVGLLPWVELAFGAYLTLAVWFALANAIWFSLPFLILFQVGFLYVGLMSLLQGRMARFAEKSTSSAAEPELSA
jgi:hypothetical protein